MRWETQACISRRNWRWGFVIPAILCFLKRAKSSHVCCWQAVFAPDDMPQLYADTIVKRLPFLPRSVMYDHRPRPRWSLPFSNTLVAHLPQMIVAVSPSWEEDRNSSVALEVWVDEFSQVSFWSWDRRAFWWDRAQFTFVSGRQIAAMPYSLHVCKSWSGIWKPLLSLIPLGFCKKRWNTEDVSIGCRACPHASNMEEDMGINSFGWVEGSGLWL